MGVAKFPSKVGLKFEDFLKKECGCWIWKGAYRGNQPTWVSRGVGKNARTICFEKHVTKVGDRTLQPKCNDPRCIRPEHQKVL